MCDLGFNRDVYMFQVRLIKQSSVYCVSHLSESRSNPDETRLRKHLFVDSTEDLSTTPIRNIEEAMNVSFEIYISKLIDLVCLILPDNLHTFSYKTVSVENYRRADSACKKAQNFIC